MKKNIQQIAALLYLLMQFSNSHATGAAVTDEAIPSPRYLQVSVDNVVIDSAGIAAASKTLAQAIDRLAQSIEKISSQGTDFTAEEREALLRAVKSVDKASTALSNLALQLPQTAQNLADRLPQVVSDARQPIAELSSGLQSARDGIFAITESLPQATESARELVDSVLDAALIRVSIYTLVLIALLSLALIGVMWFVYSQYLAPISRKLDALVGAPEHFADMSKYMMETSQNLLTLQSQAAAPPVSTPDA